MSDPQPIAAQFAPDAHALDGNAVGGLLAELFGTDVTGADCGCAHCGNVGPLGTLRVYVAAGIVLRCSACSGLVMRVMTRSDGSHLLDARGAAFIRR